MNSKKNWLIIGTSQTEKQLRRLPANISKRIEKVIDEMAENPYTGDIEKMSGKENVWRRRMGAYRIKYEIYNSEKVVKIYEVERRTSKTY